MSDSSYVNPQRQEEVYPLMRERELRRRCRRLLRDLNIRPPLDVRELCRHVGRQRGRPIELHPYPITVPGPFGLWFGLGDRDAIFYQQDTSRPHQDHIILHELGHLLAEHPSDEADVDRAATDIREDPPRDGLDGPPRARRRTCYENVYEREAELVATIILEWASVLDPHVSMVDDPGLERMSTALSHHQGWL